MSLSRLIPAIVTLIAQILPRTTNAACGTFRATSPLYLHYAQDQLQNVSQGLYCSPSYNNDSHTNGVYGGCAEYLPATNTTYTGCNAYASGSFTSTGFTNLTNLNLSDTDLDGIYTLVGNSGVPPVINVTSASKAIVGYGFYRNFSGCLPIDLFDIFWQTQCMTVGQAGYYNMEPLLKCINGTLEDCSNGPVISGTGIAICGVGTDTWNGLSKVPEQRVPWGFSGWADLTQEQALSMTVNPANTSTCAAVYKQERSFGTTERCVNQPYLYAAVALVTWLAL